LLYYLIVSGDSRSGSGHIPLAFKGLALLCRYAAQMLRLQLSSSLVFRRKVYI
jgi:hypothetical protein